MRETTLINSLIIFSLLKITWAPTQPVLPESPQRTSNQSLRHSYGNQNHQPQANFQNFNQNSLQQPQPAELAMDPDVSMRTARTNNLQGLPAQKRGLGSDKQFPPKIQRINHLAEEIPQYESQIDFETHAYADDPNLTVELGLSGIQNFAPPSFEDEINFLEAGQPSPTSSEE